MQMVAQVWNDDTGERYELAEDPDGLGLAELRFVAADGKIGDRITLPWAVLRELSDQIPNVQPEPEEEP